MEMCKEESAAIDFEEKSQLRQDFSWSRLRIYQQLTLVRFGSSEPINTTASPWESVSQRTLKFTCATAPDSLKIAALFIVNDSFNDSIRAWRRKINLRSSSLAQDLISYFLVAGPKALGGSGK
jgi:hypothetical protein